MDKIDICTLSTASDLDKDVFISKYISNSTVNIEFSYLSDFKNAKILRDAIGIIGNHIWLSKVAISRMTLIVDEMNNNAIEHGSNIWDMNKLRFTCEPQDGGIFVCIEVEDSGKWWTAKKALDMETLRAHQLRLGYKWHNSIRWRWLFMIIVNLVDRVYFKDSKTGWLIVWIKNKYEL